MSPEEISRVTLLGVDCPLNWRMDRDEGLIIDTPEKMPGEHANSFKIEMRT